jgi:hypothetical protein
MPNRRRDNAGNQNGMEWNRIKDGMLLLFRNNGVSQRYPSSKLSVSYHIISCHISFVLIIVLLYTFLMSTNRCCVD